MASVIIFSVDVGKGTRLRHFRAGTKVVLDVFRGPQDKTAVVDVRENVKTAPLVPAASASPPAANKPIRLLEKPDEKNAKAARKPKEGKKKKFVVTQKTNVPQSEKNNQSDAPINPDNAPSTPKSSATTDG